MLLTFEVSDLPFSLSNQTSASVAEVNFQNGHGNNLKASDFINFIGKHAPDHSTLVYLHMYTHISTPPVNILSLLPQACAS